jgi:hypothetical protein
MEQKATVLERILTLTREHVFTGNPDLFDKEAEAFVDLYQRRDDLLKRAIKANATLESIGPPTSGCKYLEKSLEEIRAKHIAIATELMALDVENAKVYETLKARIQGDMRDVRQTMDLNERYLDSHEPAQGFYFDKKN